MIYADSGVVMRWVEGTEPVRDPIETRWRQLPSVDRVFVTSRIARLECRCKPLRERHDDLLRLYDIFFVGKEVDVWEVDAAVVETATELRADVGLKTPDAIHAATALLAGVASFWTTDARFSKCPGLTVEVFGAV
jgi:predicted nucleic acid-binding protein